MVPEADNVGAEGAVVSGVNVVTLTVLLASELFPAASLAFTVKAKVDEEANPVTANVVAVVVDPNKTHF